MSRSAIHHSFVTDWMDTPSHPHSMAAAEFDLALLSDVGSDRPANEDSCGCYVEALGTAVFAVADGLGGFDGGAVASAMAIEVTLQAYRENPPAWGSAKRLYRAVLQANVELHSKALFIPELRRMVTTLTAVVVENGTLNASHVGDCRLYVARRNRITQISQDHTLVAEQVKRGLMTPEEARQHPERSILLRNLGHDLIVSVAKISMPLLQGDRVIVCSDGLYDVLRDHEIEQLSRGLDATAACRLLIDTANGRGTTDNLTCAIFRMLAETPHKSEPAKAPGWRERLRSFFGAGT
jgi:serine/threonine protein phosphatase PrpC